MNYRTSFILLVLVIVIGGYVLMFRPRTEREPTPPWLYNISLFDIASISLTFLGEREAFVQTESGWAFEHTGEPVDIERWGGIPLLLAGPQIERVVKEQIDNPGDFGLDPPQAEIIVTIKGGQKVTTVLGDKTPDGVSHYAQIVGFPQLILISSTWGDVLKRLVTEPPIVIPTLGVVPAPEK